MAIITGSIFQQGWDVLTITLFAYLLEEQADKWGLLHDNSSLFAAALTHSRIQVSAEDVAIRIEELVADETLLAYHDGGQRYFAIRRYQDHQGHKYFPKRGPKCPIPPLPVIRKLSEKSRESFRQCAEKLSAPVAVAVGVAVAVEITGVPHKACMAAYHEGFLKLTGEKPPIHGAADGAQLKRRLRQCREEGEWQKVLKVIEWAVSGEDKAFRENPPTLKTILGDYHYTRILGRLAMAWKDGAR